MAKRGEDVAWAAEESGEVGWKEEYSTLLRKYGLEAKKEESGLVAAWKRKTEEQNWENWQEEVDR